MSRNRWTCLSDLCSSVRPTSTITEWEQNPERRTDRQSLYSGWRLIIAAFIKLNNPVLSDIIPKQLCLHTHKYSKYRLPEQRLWVFVQSFSKYSRLVWERFGQQSKPHHNELHDALQSMDWLSIALCPVTGEHFIFILFLQTRTYPQGVFLFLQVLSD